MPPVARGQTPARPASTALAVLLWSAIVLPAADAGAEGLERPDLQVHGFASGGGFVSTSNDYIGQSSRGSAALFEAGVNFSMTVNEQLRVGLQVFTRDVGDLRDPPHIDWAYIDYRWRRWLGLRLGVIKMPFGLYNEYVDIDAARLSLLMPQSVYPLRNRDVLLSHTGAAIYGNAALGAGGELDYQLWLGSLSIPENALVLNGASLDEIDTRYVAGAQLFWLPPVEGLRVGGTVLQASIDFHLTLDPAVVDRLVMAGLVPAGFDGQLVISQRPDTLWVASAEYTRGPWLLAAEYSRWLKHQQSTLPMLLPAFDEDAERFYAMASYRFSPRYEAGTYYSVVHADANDRRGLSAAFAERFHAFQRDLAVSLRLDVNDYWLWKLEGHFIDGAAELMLEDPMLRPDRYWGLFMLKTVVTF